MIILCYALYLGHIRISICQSGCTMA